MPVLAAERTRRGAAEVSSVGRTRKRLLILLLSAACTLLACELGLRWLLFGQNSLGWSLRKAESYTAGPASDDYWRLRARLGDASRPPERLHHPDLGWISGAFDAVTLRHHDAAAVENRRPVLLFGDSYSRCTTPAGDCFEGWMERSPEAGEWALFNYGVRGYGLDQTVLLMERVTELRFEARPVVVLGIFLDQDLDRNALSFIQYAKPRFVETGDGTFELEPPPDPDTAPPIRSYLAALVSNRLGLEERAPNARRRDIESVSIHLLDRARASLEDRGLDYFVLLFADEPSLTDDGPVGWREECVFDYLRRHRVPTVSTKRLLRAAAREEGRPLSDYYGREGVLAHHLNALGNEVAFRGILRGLRGEFDEWD